MVSPERTSETKEYLIYVQLIREWMRINGITVFLFDLDDTLMKTHEVFVEKISSGLSFLSQRLPNITEQQLSRELIAIIDGTYKEVGIEPKIFWGSVCRKLAERYPALAKGTTTKFYTTLMEVYSTVPDLCPGAIETLQALIDAGARMGLVTHAYEGWTRLKVEKSGLGGYFEHVETESPSHPKTAGTWAAAINKFNVDPMVVAVVGDNVGGDIQAAHYAGVKCLLLVERGEGWTEYKKGERPPGTRIIPGVENLPKHLIREVAIQTFESRLSGNYRQM